MASVILSALCAAAITACPSAFAANSGHKAEDGVLSADIRSPSWKTRAAAYKPALIREARVQWGLNAPIPAFAGQIHQESLWKKNARSKYANGLTQFTPATERWIKNKYPRTLGWGGSSNPRWAMRALVTYDKWLYQRIDALTDCDRFAMTLSAYNGGLGNLMKDKRLTLRRGLSPYRWWGHVEKNSRRARWAFKENRGYPRKIIYTHQRKYISWGGRKVCL